MSKKLEAIRGQYRQGDTLLTPWKGKIPAGIKPRSKGRIVLRVGEVTGHAHVIEGAVAEFILNDGTRLVWVETPAEYTHPDHFVQEGDKQLPTIVQSGWYVAPEQHQYDRLEESRRVQD